MLLEGRKEEQGSVALKMNAGGVIRIGKKDFCTGGKPYVMGILNLTPDSFSDGGSYEDTDKALFAPSTFRNSSRCLFLNGFSSTPSTG